tara:strand:- start:547 stop:999 length:453 start_codon:yes stop_codon:yes gene_type:complete
MPNKPDFIMDILRHGKETRQQVGQQVGDFLRGLQPEPPMEPTAGPSDIRDQQMFFEDLIRRQTEEDRRSGESDFPYPESGPEPDMSGMTDAEITELTGDIHPARPADSPPDIGALLERIGGHFGGQSGEPSLPHPGMRPGGMPLRPPTGR